MLIPFPQISHGIGNSFPKTLGRIFSRQELGKIPLSLEIESDKGGN